MNEPRTPAETNSANRRRRARAKRGLIAGYIHELSARHGAPREQPAPRTNEPLRDG